MTKRVLKKDVTRRRGECEGRPFTGGKGPEVKTMKGMRIVGAVCASILAMSLGTLAACSGEGSSESKEPTTAQAVSAASVSIELFDANGTRVGSGSGVMIAPNLVLSSGHLIAGKHKWVVTSADGKQTATGVRGMTYDWMKYDSDKAHPRKHDVGVIHLDSPIKLAAYPKIVGEKSADGTKATRVRGNGGTFAQLEISLGKVKSSPNAFLGDGLAGEPLDTGGAVYDARGILGIVSGRGMTTGKLYVARVDKLAKWLAPKIACAGGATTVRTYAGPGADKSVEICEDAGTGTGTTSGGPNGDGTTSGGPGSSGPGGDSGGSCDGNDDGVCYGSCGSGGPNGSNGPGTPGSSGSSGSSGASSSGDGNGGTNGANPGGDGNPGSSGSSGASSSDGSSGNGGNTSNSSGGPTGGAGGSQSTVPGSDNGGSDEGEACQGPNDNPDLCPPEPDGCVGPACGGGRPDESIDYGNCACGSSGSDIYLR